MVNRSKENIKVIKELAKVMTAEPCPPDTTFHRSLAKELGKVIGFPDLDIFDGMGEGLQIVGDLDYTPTLPLGFYSWRSETTLSLTKLREMQSKINRRTFNETFPNDHFETMLRKVEEEQKEGKVTLLYDVKGSIVDEDLVIAPCFGIDQSRYPGEMKIRFISDFKSANVNRT